MILSIFILTVLAIGLIAIVVDHFTSPELIRRSLLRAKILRRRGQRILNRNITWYGKQI